MNFRHREVLGDIIYTYILCKLDTLHDVEYLSKFYYYKDECPFSSINWVVRYLMHGTEKGIIWWIKYPG